MTALLGTGCSILCVDQKGAPGARQEIVSRDTEMLMAFLVFPG